MPARRSTLTPSPSPTPTPTPTQINYVVKALVSFGRIETFLEREEVAIDGQKYLTSNREEDDRSSSLDSDLEYNASPIQLGKGLGLGFGDDRSTWQAINAQLGKGLRVRVEGFERQKYLASSQEDDDRPETG